MIDRLGDGALQAYLIDYGFADTIKTDDQNDVHVPTFRGNLLFSSSRQMCFKKTKKIDDLVSLFYMIIYLINNDQLEGLELTDVSGNFTKADGNEATYVLDQFKAYKEYKTQNSLTEIVQKMLNSPNKSDLKYSTCEILLELATYLDNADASEKPEYSKVIKILRKCETLSVRSL